MRRVPRFSRCGEVASARPRIRRKLTGARAGEDGKLTDAATSKVAERNKQNDLRSRHVYDPFRD
jgi:hypothetical protein